MKIGDYIYVILHVLKDLKVIFTALAMILVVAFAKYITTYRKRTSKIKKVKEKVKAAAAAAAEQPAAPAAEGEAAES